MELAFKKLNVSHLAFDRLKYDFETSQSQVGELEKKLSDWDILINEERKKNEETIEGIRVSLIIRD